MRYVVLGATGFLGGHLTQSLKDAGHDVVPAARSGGRVAGVPVEAVDVLDSAAIERVSEGADGAFLCTGKVSRSESDAPLLHRLHVEGTKSALGALRRARVRRVVVASTSGTIAIGRDPARIYDETREGVLEHIASLPYYRSKYFGERVALEENRDGLEVVVANPSLLLGPGDVRESSTGDVRRFLERAVAAVPSGGIAFVDARDAAEGLALAMERGRPGERYLLNAANMTLRAFFERLSRLTKIPVPALSLPKNPHLALALFDAYDRGLGLLGGKSPVDRESVRLGTYFWYCSSEKAERELGFAPRDPGETIRDTVSDLVLRKVVAEAGIFG